MTVLVGVIVGVMVMVGVMVGVGVGLSIIHSNGKSSNDESLGGVGHHVGSV